MAEDKAIKIKVLTNKNILNTKLGNEFLIFIICFTIVGFLYHLSHKLKLLPEVDECLFFLWLIFIASFGFWIFWRILRKYEISEGVVELLGASWNLKTFILAILGIITVAALFNGEIRTSKFLDLVAISIGVLAEELIFRAIFIQWLKGKMQKTGASNFFAVLISSLVFTLIHSPDHSIALLIGLFISSLILCGLYLWSGSIIFGLIFHGFANGGVLAALLLTIFYLIITWLFIIKKKAI